HTTPCVTLLPPCDYGLSKRVQTDLPSCDTLSSRTYPLSVAIHARLTWGATRSGGEFLHIRRPRSATRLVAQLLPGSCISQWSSEVRRPRTRLILIVALDREHPAEEVFVTGTFDNWAKSTKLDKVGSAYEKTVDLPKSDDKILYKVSTHPCLSAA